MFPKRLSCTYKLTIAGLLAGAMVYGVILLIIDSRLASQTELLRVQIEEQRALLTVLAKSAGQNGVSDSAQDIILDCSASQRTEFDDLLGRLDKGLTAGELQKLDSLFGRCGSFFAERKGLMVSRLTREVEVYEVYVEQLQVLESKDILIESKVDTWKQLAEIEQSQSGLLMEMVMLQDKIISTLLEGKSATSPEILAILEKVTQTQKALLETNTEAAEIRAAVTTS
jgi:hypothetical protein